MKTFNAWFQPIKKTLCDCGRKHTQVFSWGRYIRVQWRTIRYVCESCFPTQVIPQMVYMARGDKVSINARSGYQIPTWLKMPYPIE
jgi:hypothetical protein